MKALLPLLAALFFPAGACALEKQPVNAGPYVPSPTSVVSDMLTLARVGPNDFVIDLGSGDGRIVLTAAKIFGARGFGVDINQELVREANESAKKQGIADRASFRVQDLFKTDIRQATVVTMYLLPNTVNMLKDKLLAELKPGTRIISHDYPLSGWLADDTKQFDLEDKIPISGVTTTIIYVYKVPARVSGNWTATLPAAISRQPIGMRLETQRVTRLAGTARIGGKDVIFDEGKLRGTQISFRFFVGEHNYEFTGTAADDRMEGFVQARGLKEPWSAVRSR